MHIVIFGGTTEGRRLSQAAAELGARVTVSVATQYGAEMQEGVSGVTTRCGRMPMDEMVRLLEDADLCIDATHPYATGVSRSVRMACTVAGRRYVRLLRGPGGEPRSGETPGGGPKTVFVDGAAEAARYLAGTSGNILLATGAKELSHYAELDPQRLYPRILPSHDGLSACERLGIPHRNIIAMHGPFTQALNEALLRQYHIAYLVTKDGGVPGGFAEKQAAAQAVGAVLVVLRRPEETGLDFDAVLALCAFEIKSRAGD